ncbi:MAG: hypothetical protein HWD60_03055 [Defluviicoccus sp.]|nr:MAG: hypothetical protein HWD60_03055 [Defluviicoccus sp.]
MILNVLDPIAVMGVIAGSVDLSSSLPQIVANIVRPCAAAHQCWARNALQLTANLLWAAYGAGRKDLVVMIFSIVGAIAAATLLVQTLRARKQNGLKP